MASVFERAVKFLSTVENVALKTFYFRFPPDIPIPALVNAPGVYRDEKRNTFKNLSEFLKDSILWAVPKRRKCIERRRSSRFGIPELTYKMLVPKTNILTCVKCGHYHEAGVLCPNCYQKVKLETEAMQKAIEEKLGIGPVESEVVVLYEDDKFDQEFYKGKRIVEMKKPRPQIFTDNLLQKSTQGLAKTKEIIPKTDTS